MNKLDFTLVQLEKLVTHYVGNKQQEQGVHLSDEMTVIEGETLQFLMQYFLMPFKTEDLHNFSHPRDLEMNEVFNLVRGIFKDKDLFVPNSKHLANLLYEHSNHPKIKDGKLNVAYFSELVLNDEVVEAIGIFKSETNTPFLRMNQGELHYSIEHEFGFEIKGIDKGCIVLNTALEDGYQVMVVDNTNKFNDALFWKDAFLKLKPITNEYHQTKAIMDIAKNYLSDRLTEEVDVNRTEQIGMLNKTAEYFKNNKTFDQEEFEAAVLTKPEIIDSFRSFNDEYKDFHAIDVNEKFDLSNQAVKRQAKDFKSVVKLDKNFHIYIHGDHKMIEQGVDENGRKYYKLFYENEE